MAMVVSSALPGVGLGGRGVCWQQQREGESKASLTAVLDVGPRGAAVVRADARVCNLTQAPITPFSARRPSAAAVSILIPSLYGHHCHHPCRHHSRSRLAWRACVFRVANCATRLVRVVLPTTIASRRVSLRLCYRNAIAQPYTSCILHGFAVNTAGIAKGVQDSDPSKRPASGTPLQSRDGGKVEMKSRSPRAFRYRHFMPSRAERHHSS